MNLFDYLCIINIMCERLGIIYCCTHVTKQKYVKYITTHTHTQLRKVLVTIKCFCIIFDWFAVMKIWWHVFGDSCAITLQTSSQINKYIFLQLNDCMFNIGNQFITKSAFSVITCLASETHLYTHKKEQITTQYIIYCV